MTRYSFYKRVRVYFNRVKLAVATAAAVAVKREAGNIWKIEYASDEVARRRGLEDMDGGVSEGRRADDDVGEKI